MNAATVDKLLCGSCGGEMRYNQRSKRWICDECQISQNGPQPEGKDPSKPTRHGELSASEIAPPKRDKWDVAHLLARAGLSTIPEFGGPAKELFTYVIVPPVEKRRAEWMNAIAIRLKRLEEETAGFRLENLRNNELFITVVTQATSTALRTHQKDKLHALQNAVVNTARGIDIDENLQLVFLNMVDDLTPLHLRALKFFDDPAESIRREYLVRVGNKGPRKTKHLIKTSTIALLTSVLRHPPSYIIRTVVQDLRARDLVKPNDILETSTLDVALQKHTTDLGSRFLDYVEDRQRRGSRAKLFTHNRSKAHSLVMQEGFKGLNDYLTRRRS